MGKFEEIVQKRVLEINGPLQPILDVLRSENYVGLEYIDKNTLGLMELNLSLPDHLIYCLPWLSNKLLGVLVIYQSDSLCNEAEQALQAWLRELPHVEKASESGLADFINAINLGELSV